MGLFGMNVVESRAVALGLGFCMVAGAMGAWVGTGALAFSRSPAADAGAVVVEDEVDAGEEDPFAFIEEETGLNDELGEVEVVEQVWAFGLLPGGPGDPLSVASVAGVAGVGVAGVLFGTMKRKGA